MNEYLPEWEGQGPAANCRIDGKALGWLSCTSFGGAIGEDRATRGKKVPGGCALRRRTGDTTGGLTLRQLQGALAEDDVDFEIYVGSRVCSPEFAFDQLHAHRSFGLQGSTGALLGHAEQSTNGPVNHYIHVNHGKGWKLVRGHWRPSHVYVYDTAADGRRMMAQGPQWWPLGRLLAFAAALEPRGEGTSDLGPGKFYAGFFDPVPPRDPGLVLKHGAVKTTPYPDRQLVDLPAGKVAKTFGTPSFRAKVVRRLHGGDLVKAYGRTRKGQVIRGSGVWYQIRKDGTEWIHASRVDHEGGRT